MKILLYSYSHNRIGGVETFNLNFCKRMSKYFEITFVYEIGDFEKLIEISQYATVVKYTGQSFETDICVRSSAWGSRLKGKVKTTTGIDIQMCHADYRNAIVDWNFTYTMLPETSHHVCVGQNVMDSLIELYGEKYDLKDVRVIYNLLDNDLKVDRVLKLITVSRISREKGFERIIKFVKALKEYGKPFLWFIYGDYSSAYAQNIKNQLSEYPEVIFMGPKIGIASQVADCDYLVQLSDSEGFSYSIYEALQVGTPCITTNFQSAYEQITDGKNGYILDMELSNLDIDKIYKNIPKEISFKEKSTEKEWLELMGTPKTKPRPPKPKLETVKVIAIMDYFDKEKQREVKKEEILEVSAERSKVLIKAGVCQMR